MEWMCRWTDKLHGLLKTCSLHLSEHLVKLDLGCCRLGSEASFHALDNLSCLTGLTDLRMSVYSNSDTRLTLDLSQLAPLSNLQVRRRFLWDRGWACLATPQ
jgi:hypothetical protein